MAVRSEFQEQSRFVGSPNLDWRGPHSWHQGERVWSATNSHLDVWIELLHTLDLDPAPVVTPALCADFQGDHWTLTTVSPADLWACYGISVEELFVWRPLLAHVVEQLDRGNALLVEVDAFHLPDMVGSSYHREHTKTLVAITGYDRVSHRLRYLHGMVGGDIGGDDLDALLSTGLGASQLAPHVTVVRLDRLAPRTPAERAQIGIALARFHGTRLPARNPVREFSDALRSHGAWLAGGDAELYQCWAYANLQQCGAAFEVGADVCSWLAQHGEPVAEAVAPLRMLSHAARALHQRLVRVSQSGRMPEVGHTLEDMAKAWDDAMSVLKPIYGV